jgi:hypothetical protein
VILQSRSSAGGPAATSKAPPGCFVAVVAVTALIGLGFLATILAIVEPVDEPSPTGPVGPGTTGTTVAPARDGVELMPAMRGPGNATGAPFRAGGAAAPQPGGGAGRRSPAAAATSSAKPAPSPAWLAARWPSGRSSQSRPGRAP